MDHRDELRTLVELARLGNARRTAELLRVSQSTVSEVIARLERSYATRLFDRGRQGSHPTATGALVVEAARRSLEILDNAEREVGLLEGFERGSLSVAGHPFLIESYLTPAIAALLHESANLHCRVRSASPAALLEGLRGRQLELFIGLEPDAPCGDIAIERIGTYTPVPFCRAGHPLSAVPPQGIKVLGKYPLITTESPLWYSRRIEAGMPVDPALAGELVERGRRVEVADLAAMESLVATTDSLGFANRESVRKSVDAGMLVVLGVPEEERVLLEPAPIVLVTMKDRPLPPSANALIEQIRSIAARRS